MDSLGRELAGLRDAVHGARRAVQTSRELADTVNETIRVLEDAANTASDVALRLHIRDQLGELRRATNLAAFADVAFTVPDMAPATPSSGTGARTVPAGRQPAPD
eukprot:5541903-Alexandrium_andersonii.AAC.1